jgi:hypothetical protein
MAMASPTMVLLGMAEKLMGPSEYDPMLLLALAMDDSVLINHTCFGQRLLMLLDPLLSSCQKNRELLLSEARCMVSSSKGWLCVEMMRRVVGLTKEPKASVMSKKNLLLEEFLETNREKCMMAYPSLLQVVYRSGARKHYLAERWQDALQFEMQEMFMRCRDADDEDWMKDACRIILSIDFKKQMATVGGKKGMRKAGGSGPLQVIFHTN